MPSKKPLSKAAFKTEKVLNEAKKHPDKVVREVAQQLVDELKRTGRSAEDIGMIKAIEDGGLDLQTLRLWTTTTKDEEGNPEQTTNYGLTFRLSPTWDEGPEYPLPAPAPPITVKHAATKPVVRPDGWLKAMTLPDMQIGYWRDRKGELHPIHDESAIDLALQLVRHEQPNLIVLHGDNLDFAGLSTKFETPKSQSFTVQATIDRGGLMVAQLRAAAGPDCEIAWIEGNHEKRMLSILETRAKELIGIRPSDATPQSWPVLSVPFLCRTEEHGVEYITGYPTGEKWINDRLVVVHGDKVASNGSTVHKYLSHERVSVVFGHIHRREWAERTRRGPLGKSHTILAMSPGCLCRTDGVVPSTKGGTNLDGEPTTSVEDWQQGVSIFHYQPGDGAFFPEMVAFWNGTAWRGDKMFQASVDLEGNPL